MHTLSAWFTRNPVAANLLMMLMLIAGVFTVQSIRIEGFPALPPDSVSISTIYPGASAEQVERGISRKVEKALEGMPGIKRIRSVSAEGLSTVAVQKTSRMEMDRFQNEIQSRVDSIFNLPQRAERPMVTRQELNVEALIVQVYGVVDDATLQKVARDVRTELLADPQIARMELFGLRPYEVRLEVDADRLRSHGVTLTDVAEAVGQFSLDYRTGSIESGAGRVVIRADGKAFNYEEFAAIPVRTLADGTRLLVRDVATVIDGFETEQFFARYQGQPSVGMQVYTGKQGHLLRISEAAHKVIERLKPQLPAGVQLDIWAEYAVYMQDRLTLLASNAWQGLLIVFVLLALFLNFKLAFWVAMGIPISLAGALVLMGDRFLGYSLNDITTFGMIIVLGILVDDAIVVGESVFAERSKGGDAVDGTIRGVHRVSTATVFGCFTTVAAFYPMLLIDNELGKMLASFAVVVIVAVLISMAESKLILPAHLAAIGLEASTAAHAPARFWRRVQAFTSRLLESANRQVYRRVLGLALAHRYTAIVLLTSAAICGIAVIANGWLRTVFFPEVPGQIISVSMQVQSGAPLSLTRDNLAAIEAAADQLNQEVMAELGTDQPPIVRIMAALTGDYSALVFAELQPERQRQIETLETVRRWRETVGRLEGIETLHFSGSEETGGGFAVELSARDDAVLAAGVDYFTERFGQLSGVSDVRDDLHQGSPQIRLRLKPEAQHLGITMAQLASQLGDAFGGLEIQRVQRGSEEVTVMARYRQERRRTMRDLLDVNIRTPDGQYIPLPLVATFEAGTAPSALYRRNGRRTVLVEASLDKGQLSATEAYEWVKTNIMPELSARYPQLSILGVGELEEIGEMQGNLRRALIMILILIYALLAVPLKSYWQPFVIMSVIPFGFLGAVIGHWVMGTPLSILSFFGMMAVTGVVVNDSLVLLTRYNDTRDSGRSLDEALVTAGTSRFRAVVLTTVTTVCGLMPLMFETSEQAQYLIPAAISLAWGELVATPATLILVPVLIRIAHDGVAWGRRLLALPPSTAETVDGLQAARSLLEGKEQL